MNNLPKIIVIGQQQRCGGSLMVRLFDGHDKVAVHPLENYCGRPYKYHLPMFDIKALPEKVWESIFEPSMMQMSRLKKYQGFRFKYIFSNHKHLFLNNYPSDNATYQSIYLHYLDSLFKSISEYSNPANPEYYLYFAPRQALYAEEILGKFEGSHVIQSIRNPLGFFNSVKFHNRFYDMDSAKFIWRLFFFNSMYCIKKRLPNYHLVIFEDMLKEPEHYLRKLCKDIDIEYNKTLLAPTFGKFKWRGDSRFRNLDDIESSVAYHYQKYLNSEEISFFEKEVLLYESLRQKIHAQQDITKWDDNEIVKELKTFTTFLSMYKREKPVNTKSYIFTPEGEKLYDSMIGGRQNHQAYVFYVISNIEERSTLISFYEMTNNDNSNKIPPMPISKAQPKLFDADLFAQFLIGLVNIYGLKKTIIFVSEYLNSNQLSKAVDATIQLFRKDSRGISLKFLIFLCKIVYKENDLRRLKSFYMIGTLFLTWLKSIRVRFLIRPYSEYRDLFVNIKKHIIP